MKVCIRLFVGGKILVDGKMDVWAIYTHSRIWGHLRHEIYVLQPKIGLF